MYHNATLIAGCLDVSSETLQQFEGQSLCQRKREYTACGCSTFDRCNSPQAPSSGFKFVDEPIFDGYNLVPTAVLEGSQAGMAKIFKGLAEFWETIMWRPQDRICLIFSRGVLAAQTKNWILTAVLQSWLEKALIAGEKSVHTGMNFKGQVGFLKTSVNLS